MTRIALRYLWARKLRTALSSIAIVLGVMMVTGTYVLTDTINASFDEIFTQSNAGIDAVVTSHQAVQTDDGTRPPLPASVLRRVRGVDGVAAAAGGIFDPQIAIIGSDGKPAGGHGAPTFGASALPQPFDSLSYSGGPPRTAREVVIDKATADREGFQPGDTISIAGKDRAHDYTLVGTATLAGVDSFGGASIAIFTLREAQRITAKRGKFDQVSVVAADGVTPEQLAAQLKGALPSSVKVETAAQNIESQKKDVGSFTGILKTILLIFAGVALFVAAFLIFNTFSIIVAQRTREFGMLRALGANRRQIVGSVVLEAFVIGLGASVVGIVAGIGFASVLESLFKSVGIDLPSTGTVVATRTIATAMIVGTLITVLSALIPAIRATRVPPIAAIHEGAVTETAAGRRRSSVAGAGLAIVGLIVMACGLFSVLSPGEVWIGGGAVATFIGVALLSPRVVRPLASIVGRPLERFRGVSGRIARENAVRNPGRTASTAAALMIGLALVSFVAVFTAGLKGSIDKVIDQTIAGDLILTNRDGFSDIPVASARAARSVPGVEVASPLRYTQDRVDGHGGGGSLTLVDPASVASVLELDWVDGSQDLLSRLTPTDAVIDAKWGSDNGLAVGDTFVATTPSGKRITYTARGSINDNTDLIGDYAASSANAAAYDEADTAIQVLLKLDPGADAGAVRAQLDQTMTSQFPTVEVQDHQQLKDLFGSQLNALLGAVYALLALAIVVSLFGIVNTLALTIYERTRELGLLRAVGMSRRQVRRMVRYEAVITALIGGLLGAALGVVFAILASRPLADDGFVLSFPVETLAGLLVLAVVAGVVAAIGPARRASRIDVLEAVAYE